jgi:hypothetical protein
VVRIHSPRFFLPYLNENLARLATILRENGIIDALPDPLPVL